MLLNAFVFLKAHILLHKFFSYVDKCFEIGFLYNSMPFMLHLQKYCTKKWSLVFPEMPKWQLAEKWVRTLTLQQWAAQANPEALLTVSLSKKLGWDSFITKREKRRGKERTPIPREDPFYPSHQFLLSTCPKCSPLLVPGAAEADSLSAPPCLELCG